jgi:hypothetical protein
VADLDLVDVRDLLESLSLESGAGVVAACSALLAWPLCYVRLAILRWAVALAVPFILAYALYWTPVWLGAPTDEYSPWRYVFIGIWFLAGVVPSAFVIIAVGRYRAKQNV